MSWWKILTPKPIIIKQVKQGSQLKTYDAGTDDQEFVFPHTVLS